MVFVEFWERSCDMKNGVFLQWFKKVQYVILAGIISLAVLSGQANAAEAIIGKTTLSPGIAVVFEGAVKDQVWPPQQHLAEMQTDVHLEARVNWSTAENVELPEGTPGGGFVPYLHINAEVTNERTGKQEVVTLIPHINLVDNFHYARNISLPGNGTDSYTIRFFVNPPGKFELSYHRDWQQNYGNSLFQADTLTYREVSFAEIVEITR